MFAGAERGVDKEAGQSHSESLKRIVVRCATLWERACSRLDRRDISDSPRHPHREQARSHMKAISPDRGIRDGNPSAPLR
ncbi:hypothetical protein DXT77_10325 [Pseudomonas sp. 91RF]|nr:hypothetical protein DXT77_10325 [Pseudomonas sp. 91RF]